MELLKIQDVSQVSYKDNDNYPQPMKFNNPLKVIKSNYKGYIGRVKYKDRTDKSNLEKFNYYWQGVLAATEILENYYFDFDCKTPEKLLNKYTDLTGYPEAFISDICKATGLKARYPFEWNRENAYLLISEMARIFNRRNALITSELFAFVWLKIPLNE